MEGNSRIQCDGSGRWSAQAPFCRQGESVSDNFADVKFLVYGRNSKPILKITKNDPNSTASMIPWIVFCGCKNIVLDILTVYHQTQFLGTIAPSERLDNLKATFCDYIEQTLHTSMLQLFVSVDPLRRFSEGV